MIPGPPKTDMPTVWKWHVHNLETACSQSKNDMPTIHW